MTPTPPEAGRELDAMVVEKVFSNPTFTTTYGAVIYEHSQTVVPNYSTDPAAAWSVVEQMRELGYNATIKNFNAHDPSIKQHWLAGFNCPFGPCERHGNKIDNYHGAQADANTMPLAVCRAALAALAPRAGEQGGA